MKMICNIFFKLNQFTVTLTYRELGLYCLHVWKTFIIGKGGGDVSEKSGEMLYQIGWRGGESENGLESIRREGDFLFDNVSKYIVWLNKDYVNNAFFIKVMLEGFYTDILI